MRIAFISDIHGNAIALEAVLRDITTKAVNKIVVLGDLCFRGPEPRRSLELIRSLDADVLKGNADEWVIRGIRDGEVPDHVINMMRAEREWTISQLEQSELDYLTSLPTQLQYEIDRTVIYAFHATPDSLFEIVPPHADDQLIESKLMQPADAQVYIYAHIHKPYIRYLNGKIIMNIGSVGLPFDGVAKASYGLVTVTEGNISTSIERVSFDVERAAELYKKVNYPNAEMMMSVVRNAKV